MIAHVAKPGNLNDALEKVMLTEDHASPIPEPPPLVEAQVSPIETNADVKPVVRRSKSEKGTDGGILGELTALQRRARNKVTLNTRIDDWIARAIEKALRDLEEAGVTNVTKEAIVCQSLVRGLKLTPPEGWDPLQ
jgi:hypothetical protein